MVWYDRVREKGGGDLDIKIKRVLLKCTSVGWSKIGGRGCGGRGGFGGWGREGRG